MAGEIFRSTIATTIEESLDEICTDPLGKKESGAVFTKYMQVSSMSDAFKDDEEIGGPGLLHEKGEGQEIAVGTIREGFRKRYIPRTFALRMIISQEALEDGSMSKVIKAGGRLNRAAWKTPEYDSVKILARGHSSSYPGPDGVSLWNSSHTLPHGGTFSNTLATPAAPSVQAYSTARTQVAKYPSHDGLLEGFRIKKILCPEDQYDAWRVILGSSKHPDPGEFNAMNVAYEDRPMLVPIVYWSNTTTNWAGLTDAEDGIQFLWRVRFQTMSWVDNARTNQQYAIRGRWDTGWTNARCTIGSNS